MNNKWNQLGKVSNLSPKTSFLFKDSKCAIREPKRL